MKKQYILKGLCWLLVGVSGLVGCHQEPVLPESAIPTTCQVYQRINIDENVRDSTLYTYNSFGLIERTSYQRFVGRQVVTKIDQAFTYTGDHYLSTQIDRTTTWDANRNSSQQNKGYTYTYKEGRIDQVAIVDNSFGTRLGFRQYTYEGDKLKTYTETDGNAILTRRYTFDDTGKLVNYEEAGLSQAIVSNGKIVKRVYANGTAIDYTYDAEGQLKTQINTAPNSRQEATYSYDNRPYWDKTQLRLRGIPTPDLGDHVQRHNMTAYSFKQVQNGQTTNQRNFSYEHNYNKAGYSRGFSRNDGARQINLYSNCL
jgi:YD repeat-containing protein